MKRHNNNNDDDDDGKLPAATTKTGGEQPTIHQAISPLQLMSYTMALVSLSGAQPFPSCHRQRLTLSGGDDDNASLL